MVQTREPHSSHTDHTINMVVTISESELLLHLPVKAQHTSPIKHSLVT